jgi:hypothetical protein
MYLDHDAKTEFYAVEGQFSTGDMQEVINEVGCLVWRPVLWAMLIVETKDSDFTADRIVKEVIIGTGLMKGWRWQSIPEYVDNLHTKGRW